MEKKIGIYPSRFHVNDIMMLDKYNLLIYFLEKTSVPNILAYY